MEEKKNNKGIIWLIVILIILVLVLVGYIVYDKVLLKEKKSVDNDTTTTTESLTNEKVFNSYPVKNDDTILAFDLSDLSSNDKVDLTKNFQNLKLHKENIEYTISCKEYNQENGCSSFEILINNVKLHDYISEGGQNFKHIIIVGEYLLEQVYSSISSCGYIKIFKNGELIYTVKDTTAEMVLNGNSFDSVMRYNNNKLYYFIQTKNSNKSYNVLKMIDFNKTEIFEAELERKELENNSNATCYNYSSEFE